MARNGARIKEPRKDTIAYRVAAFLYANPDEELGRPDVARKFGVDPTAVDLELAPAIAVGWIAREQGDDGTWTWRCGDTKSHAVPWPFQRRRRIPVRVDFGTIVVEQGIPLAEQFRSRSGWNDLFGRMSPGDSFQVPNAVRAALAHAQADYRKTTPGVKFAIRKMDGVHTRIWRIE